MPEKHPLRLKIPDLWKPGSSGAPTDIDKAVHKKAHLEGGKEARDPDERIEIYIARLERLFLNPDKRVRERNVEMLRPRLHENLVSRMEVVIDEMLAAEARIAREQGHGEIRITDEMRQRPETLRQAADIIERQQESLDAWIDYLSSDDAAYGENDQWYKWYIFSNVLRLQALEKREKIDEKTGAKSIEAVYPKRNDRTLKPFPDIYRGKLSTIFETYEKYLADGGKKDEKLKAYFDKSFPKVYAEESLDYIENAGKEGRAQTDGKWIKYRKGNEEDVKKLVASLKNKYTDWCTEGHGTARNQLMQGDFYVYYTFDEQGKPTNPRIAIRMGDNRIAEVRGIAGGKRQEIEGELIDVADVKLKEFGPDADAYKKKSSDMRLLTIIEKKAKGGQPLVREELVFLYEIESKIEGFGYQRDPRIKEILSTRNPKEDAPILFGCAPEEIAWKREEINERTKAYVGPLFEGVFRLSLEHLYTSFPEGKVVELPPLKIGSKEPYPKRRKANLKSEIKEKQKWKSFEVSEYAYSMIDNEKFVVGDPETLNLVHLSVADLGFPRGATTKEIFERAQKLGLALVPPETGPRLRLSYGNQPSSEYLYMGMDPIADSDGHLSVFRVLRHGDGGAWLSYDFASPGNGWHPEFRFVFRKLELDT